jgi:hypothetical protein
MAKTRYYSVVDRAGKQRMVRANGKQMAIGFCARSEYSATLASQEQIVQFMKNNDPAVIEDATTEKEEAE